MVYLQPFDTPYTTKVLSHEPRNTHQKRKQNKPSARPYRVDTPIQAD
jgi:hypothetical protein